MKNLFILKRPPIVGHSNYWGFLDFYALLRRDKLIPTKPSPNINKVVGVGTPTAVPTLYEIPVVNPPGTLGLAPPITYCSIVESAVEPVRV